MNYGTVNLKCTLGQALRLCTGHLAHRGSRGIAIPLLTMALEGGEGSASGAGRTLPPVKTWYPLYWRLGGPQGWFGQVRKISPPTRIRSPERPARSQSYELWLFANWKWASEKIFNSNKSFSVCPFLLLSLLCKYSGCILSTSCFTGERPHERK
jgi:hypothetical protein